MQVSSALLPALGSYVNARWITSRTPSAITVRNPATEEPLADLPALDAAATRRAIEAAASALRVEATLSERRNWLVQLADLHLEHKKELGRIITLENGKPWSEAQAEVEYAAGFYRYFAENLGLLETRALKERSRNHDWTVEFRPAGVIALITPWNFPLAMVAKKLSAALAAGCAVVVKPSEKTPLSMIALFALLEEIGLPPGRANLLIGEPAEIGSELLKHPLVRLISFTGSTAVGKQLIERSARGVKRLALELGGNAPFIVFGDADLESAATHLIQNKFRCAGQTCVCANRVYVEAAALEEFSRRVVEKVRALRVGDGMESSTDIGPLIDSAGRDKVERHVKDALEKGATLGCGGRRVGTKGFFYAPTVLLGVTHEMLCTKEETFGPVVPIIEFGDEAAAVEAANATEYGLAAYVFTRDAKRAERVIPRLSFGHVGHNTGTGPTPEAPFGGMKQSGFGREGGREGLFEFVEVQAVARGGSS
jgi:succinate-semialdehyde dehydrogenase/glutarate-semialdehyde dehydrogenase